MQVVGVDGCPGGWIAVVWQLGTNAWTPHFHRDFSDLAEQHQGAVYIGIDIPIGLRDDGRARGCDVAARALLGWPRGASVFPAPQRRLLACDSYATASATSQAAFGKGISRQAFGIFPKVREVNVVMTPGMQRRIVEVHPEVSFWAMNLGQPMETSKKRVEGFEARRDLLRDCLSVDVPETRRAARLLAPLAGADDLLDALAAAWTARRCAEGAARTLVAEPNIDADGLRMEIVF